MTTEQIEFLVHRPIIADYFEESMKKLGEIYAEKTNNDTLKELAIKANPYVHSEKMANFLINKFVPMLKNDEEIYCVSPYNFAKLISLIK